MTNMQDTIAPAAGIEALQAQLHDAEDAIGRISISWRQAASNPAAMEAAAERLNVLERQRDMLRAALADAQHAQAAIDADDNGRRVQALIERARELVTPMLEARIEKGRQLEEAVLRVATLVRELHEQAQEIRRDWPQEAIKASGLNTMHAAFGALNQTDLHVSIGQLLAWRLGSLWPEERAWANQDESPAQRIAHEVGPIRYAFEQGLRERAPTLQVPASVHAD